MLCTRGSLEIGAVERRETGRRTGDGGVFAAMPRVAPVSALTARGFARGRAPAGSGRFRRKRALISPWVLGFCAVFAGSCSLSASPTWENAGAVRRFGPIRPAKPPRSRKRGLLVLRVAYLSVRFGSAGAGRGHCDCCGYRQGSFANLPMSRWGHRRYRPTSCPPSLRAAIRLGNACGPTRFRLCISAWRPPASARISRRGTCRRRGLGGGSPCSAARWRCSS